MNRAITVGTLVTLAGTASAQSVTVTVENMLQQGSFSFTPVWMALHNGQFDSYDNGAPATPELEALAEDGLTGPISALFQSSPAGLAGGVDLTLAEPNGAPVFGPGESNSITFGVGDPMVNRYFSYASMVVPTNDLFIANGNPLAHEVFDAAGNFNGPIEILVFGRNVNDAGTEVNNANGGAAFSILGGDPIDENSVIRNFFTEGGDQAYLDSFIGTGTVDGGTITASFGPDDLIARIVITPAPSSVALLGVAGVAGLRRRR